MKEGLGLAVGVGVLRAKKELLGEGSHVGEERWPLPSQVSGFVYFC